ncbi:MAG TPA: UDP-N-acetylglucosamine 1-carboxyvinyltransferase [Verrucomicrobiota bacterium]|nr:UDP-N-acetylglucosamine 1-carboxyvinyltransferase [Verrucomicrobiota bacterium]HNU50138.1 UDP-N-acetylglucosamine 1-carboxyvinyltransferase [Verrucomicrobiota bacterium]
MAKYAIDGGKQLKGVIFVQGAKNAALPMISAALLPISGQTVLRNVPLLNDILVSLDIIRSLGGKAEYFQEEQTLVIDPSGVSSHTLDSSLTTRSRASILFLPTVFHRFGKVQFKGVGGCNLGYRSLNFHHNGFKRLGALVEGDEDVISIAATRLKGNLVYLDTPSQTSTENLIMAACLAEGETIIENAACEPEVADFVDFLRKMGARISGEGSRTLRIQGVSRLHPTEHTVMSDRLDAGPLMMAAAITNGDLRLIGARLDQMRILTVKLQQMGVSVESNGEVVRVEGIKQLKPINVVSQPYPGFSTDFLPGLMSLACVAGGRSDFRENIFLDRLTQVDGLKALGADIEKESPTHAIVRGVEKLAGTQLGAPDLRAGMAYVLAALRAEGRTVIDNVYQIERGHCNIPERLRAVGADIQRVAE